MCGRYTLSASASELSDRFDATVPPTIADALPRYNCAPGQTLPVITNTNPNQFQELKWGLIPSWADDDTGGQINARAEPNEVVSSLHHRMAVVLPPESESTWLHEDADTVESLLTPHPGDKLDAYPVSTRVNSPANDESSLIDPI